MKSPIHIGMSGWSYWDWREMFYPAELKSTEWLEVYARVYGTTEINSSFYHLPRVKTTLRWTEQVPKGFKFCPKTSKYLTHIQKLKDPAEPLQRFFTTFEPMKKMLGPVLIQLPPSLKFDGQLVTHFFETLKNNYSEYDFALEARHNSWLEKDVIKLLKQYHITWVISQSGVGYPYLEEVTAKNIYVRFHGPGKLYASSYPDEVLRAYAAKFRKWAKEGHDVWVFFNNTMQGIALENANTLKKMLRLK